MEWIIANKTWLFSGIGIFILNIVIYIIFKRKSQTKLKIKQKSGNNSKNYVAIRDINIKE